MSRPIGESKGILARGYDPAHPHMHAIREESP